MARNTGDSRPINARQEAFCKEYVVDWNQSRAAREAGYSHKTACVIANELLKKPKIQRYINELKKETEKLCGVSVVKQLREYKKIAYASVLSIHDNWITLTNFEEVKALNPDIFDAVESIEVKDERVKVKFHSKIAALERIDKIMGYDSALKTENVVDLKTNDVSKYTEEEKAFLLKLARKYGNSND